ncbi:MAG: hypothetical protein IJU23_03635 [Proteobacteria bacterium]|nr:hypothetical protein [Pseudomonadota bacterium]
MSVYSKLFGKKKTVDTANPAPQQHVQAPAQNGPNVQAQMFNDFEVVNAPGDGAPVADVYLNVDTESKSRSHMSVGELWAGDVGHTWLTIKPLNGQLPADLNDMVQESTRNLVEAHGETAVGFWPVEVREKRTEGKKISDEKAEKNAEANAKQRSEMAIRRAKGLTRGSGAINREEAPEYDLHSPILGHDTAGRVEEPDDSHSPKGRKVYRITRKQFRDMYRYIDAHRTHKYNLYSYNCTTFAAHALQAAGQSVPMEGKTMPTSLYEAMYKEAKAHEEAVKKAKKKGRAMPGASSVELLKLGKGEVHRQKRKSKEGPDGKDVRVKGVDKFDMAMFTDDVEIALHKAATSERITGADRSEFAQLLFRNSHRRTLDAVKAYTEEAVKIGLISQVESTFVVDFYENGFNTLEDPTPITTHPDFFRRYMMDIYEAMPNPESFAILMDGDSVSAKHNAKTLTKQLMWTIVSSDKEVGNGYEAFVEPLPQIALIEPIMPDIIDGMVEAIQHLGRFHDKDLYRIQYLINHFFLDNNENNNKIKAITKEYLKVYFNKRIDAHVMNQKMYEDAVNFAEATDMTQMIQSWFPKLARARDKATQYNAHSTIFSKTGTALNTLPAKYKKAPKAAQNARKPDENEIVAEVYLNADVSPDMVKKGKNVSRSKLTGDVGHVWLTLKAIHQDGQPNGMPSDIEAEMQKTATGKTSVNIMRAKGETAMGFYPLQNAFINQSGKRYQKKTSDEDKEKHADANLWRQAVLDLRHYKGFSKGDGDVEREETQYTGYSYTHDVTGRVEEPDDAHTPKGRKRFTLTRKQFKKLYAYVESHRNHNYNLRTYNCTTFATHALRDAGHHASGSRLGICYPAKLYREMYDEAKRDTRNNNQNSKVQLLKLAENESHGEFRPGKTGNGADVRVHGVDKFDMVTDYIDPVEIEIRKLELKENRTDGDNLGLVSRIVANFADRSPAEGIHLINEATRMGLLTPEQQENLVYLNTHFGQLKQPIVDYARLPLSQVYDFLVHMEKCLTKNSFEGTFDKHMPVFAARILRETVVGTPDFQAGIKILKEFSAEDQSKSITDSIANIPLRHNTVLGVIDLFANFIINNPMYVFETIKKYNDNNVEESFNFVIDTFHEPTTTKQTRDLLSPFIGMFTEGHPNPAAALEKVMALKNEGLINDANYNIMKRDLEKKIKK